MCNTIVLQNRNSKSTYKRKHTNQTLFPKGYQTHLKYSSETPTFYQNDLAMRNTADVPPDRSPSQAGMSAVNP
jgi:hypothetical protein